MSQLGRRYSWLQMSKSEEISDYSAIYVKSKIVKNWGAYI
jgi:hypothetical protein